MKKQTWVFNETGTIPGIPGEWHAGQEVDIDEDTMTVVDVRLREITAQSNAASNTEPLQEKASAIAKTSTLPVSSPLAQESQTKK